MEITNKSLYQINNLEKLRDSLIYTYSKLEITHDNFEEIKSEVREILNNYKGSDWTQHVTVNTCKYHRDVFFTSDKFDIVVITWAPTQKCPIHNHPDDGCTVKILRGNITEERYNTDTLEKLYTMTYYKDDVMYIDNTLGYHKMSNNGLDICITLHVYAPGHYCPTIYN